MGRIFISLKMRPFTATDDDNNETNICFRWRVFHFRTDPDAEIILPCWATTFKKIKVVAILGSRNGGFREMR